MLYAMLAACATVILAFAVLVRLKPIAAWHASFGQEELAEMMDRRATPSVPTPASPCL